MCSEIRIYYEGDKSLKSGFWAFLSSIRTKAQEKRCKFDLIATEGTPERDFGIALRSHPTALNILLRDSEGPDTGKLSVSLCVQHGWDTSNANSIFWMVEAMESWFHADKGALEAFYRTGFRKDALKGNLNVEQISKKDLLDGLKAATSNTSKGAYHKTKHAPQLLARIDPDRVRKAAPNCDKVFQFVIGQL